MTLSKENDSLTLRLSKAKELFHRYKDTSLMDAFLEVKKSYFGINVVDVVSMEPTTIDIAIGDRVEVCAIQRDFCGTKFNVAFLVEKAGKVYSTSLSEEFVQHWVGDSWPNFIEKMLERGADAVDAEGYGDFS